MNESERVTVRWNFRCYDFVHAVVYYFNNDNDSNDYDDVDDNEKRRRRWLTILLRTRTD